MASARQRQKPSSAPTAVYETARSRSDPSDLRARWSGGNPRRRPRRLQARLRVSRCRDGGGLRGRCRRAALRPRCPRAARRPRRVASGGWPVIHLGSQQLKLLRAFRVAPGRTLSTNQLLSLRVPRYSARMHEMKLLGFRFDRRKENGEWLYTLVSEPQEFDVEGTVSDSPDQSGQTIDDRWAAARARGRKAQVVSGDAGLITRASADGSLSA